MTAPSVAPNRLAGGLAVLATPPILLFWVLREPPASVDCYEREPPGQAAAVEAYREGLELSHGLVLLAAVGLMLGLSATRRAAGDGPAHGGGTATFAVFAVGMLVASVASDEAFEIVGLVAVVAAYVLALPAGVVAAGCLGWWLGRRLGWLKPAPPKWRWRGAAAAGWLFVFVLVPVHAVLVTLQGAGPLFC